MPQAEARRRELLQSIAAKEAEKDRVLDAYRRGLIDIDALDTHIQWSRLELEPLQAELASIATAEAERGQSVGRLADAESLLKTLRDQIQGPLAGETRQRVVEALVSGISIETTGEGRKKQAHVDITYAFSPEVHAVDNGTTGCGPLPGPGPASDKALGCRPSTGALARTKSISMARWAGRKRRSRASLASAVVPRSFRKTTFPLSGSPGTGGGTAGRRPTGGVDIAPFLRSHRLRRPRQSTIK